MADVLGGSGIWSMVLWIGMIFLVMYFIVIRPQQKQQKRHQDLIQSLKKGDEVMLYAGIIGRIFSVEDRFVVLEIGDKVKMKVQKQAVAALTGSASALAAGDQDKV